MNSRYSFFARVASFVLLLAALFQPQFHVFAAPILTVTPITWNVIGLDSNDVNVGPNNFPVGVRVCNTGDATATNVSADFVWDSFDTYINLRPGSLDPITIGSLAAGTCEDAYFEIEITRDSAAYDNTRDYHITVTGDGGLSVSTPANREIYVEHLVSQNRNSVTDIVLDGVSIAPGGTMNLNIGQTYTIVLVGSTATGGYEQIESFINFPGTIFQINSVASTYTANGGTDATAATKLYADGCGWDNDTTSGSYRSCTGVGKYGGDITVTYNVTIIATSASSGTINALLYDFSGSSYHYNNDFSTSSRIYNIIDPNACTQVTMAAWNFSTAGSATASTDNVVGTPTFSVGGTGIAGPTVAGGVADFTGWPSAIDTTKFVQLSINTTGYYNVSVGYDSAEDNNNGPDSANFYYSSDGSTFSQDGGTETNTTTFASQAHNLTSVSAIDDNSSTAFRWVPFAASQTTRAYQLDNVSVVGCKLPASLSLAKSGNPATFTTAGQIITYTYTLTNTGSVSLQSPYTITDSKGAAMTISCASATSPLAPGTSTICTGTYTVTAADVTAGFVTNTATAGATTVIGDAVTSNIATETVELAALNVVKEVSTSAAGPWSDSVTVNVGDTVFFQITLNNTGTADLTGITMDDGMAACTLTGPSGDTDTDNNLDVAETWVYTCSITAVAGTNIVNTATVDSNETEPDADTAFYTGQQADLTVTKTNNVSGSVLVNGNFNWTITATNSGDGTATFADTQVIMSDPLPGAAGYYPQGALTVTNGATPPTGAIACSITGTALSCVASGGSVTLPAGASFSVTFTVTPSAAGSLANTATVDPNGNVTESNEDNNTGSDSVTVVAPPAIDKSFGAATFPLSTTTTLTFTITNSNTTVALTGVAFSDTLPAGLTVADSTSAQCGGTLTTTAATGVISLTGATIAASGNCTFNVTVTGATAGVKNNTTGNVTSTNGGTGNTASASTTVIAPPSISKNFSPDPILVGETSTLTFTITNSNTTVALTGVGFTDPLPAGLEIASTPNASASAGCGSPTLTAVAGNNSFSFSGGTIAASGTCTVSVDVTATTGGTKNNTTLNIVSTNGGTGDAASDTLTVNTPSFTIGKVPSVASVNAAGNVIVYTITLTNTGTATLTGVSVSDPLLSDLDCDGTPGAPFTTTGFTVSVGNALTCTGSYTVTQADLDNNGGGDGDIDNTATGDTNETPPQNASTAVPVIQNPSHTTLKTEISTGPYVVGNTITYNIEVTNTGNLTLTGVTVVDNNATVGTCTPVQPSTLAPTATMTCSASHVVTQADVDAGSFVNTATGDTNQTPPSDSTVTVNFTQTPGLAIVKEVSTDNATWNNTSVSLNVGDTVYYRVRVSNTGNITLTGLTVDDGMAGCTLLRGTDNPGNNDNNFEPNEQWVYTCSLSAVVGTNNNTATADSNQTAPVTDDASYTATVIPAPAMNVTKNGALDMTVVAPNTRADAGDVINYTVNVQNSGNTTLTGVTVSDPLLGDLDCDGTAGAPFVTTGLTINVATTLTCTGTYTLTQADLDNNGGGDGDIDNTVTATSNEAPNDTASAAVPLPLVPAIDLTKTLNSATFNNPNEVRLTYTINVQNTGNVTLTNIQVTDDLVAAFPGAASFNVFSLTSATFTVNPGFDGDTDQNMLAGTDSLAVGAGGSITLVVDVDTGGDEDNYVNLSTGFGTPPSGPPVQDDGQAGSPTFVDPALTKAVNPTQASVGDTVTFTITVTNAGNVPAPDVQVIDALPAMFDVTAVNVNSNNAVLLAATVTTVNPPIGGAAPFTVTVDIGGPAGAGNVPLGVTDVVTIQVVTVVNSLGNPPIINNAVLTTTALTNNVLNDADNVTITLVAPGIGGGGGSAPSLPATGFAPDVVTPLRQQPEELKYSATDVWLEIPSLGVKMPIVGVPLKKGGWDVSWLANQAGWLEGSAFPSWNGNSVLTGHVTSAKGLSGPFANLSKLKYGDKVIVHAGGQKYIFEIRTNEVVSPNDASAYKHEEKSWVTLITCQEYDAKTNSYKKRVIVRAVLIEVK